MIALSDKSYLRTIQTAEIAYDTTAIRALDWSRDRFDIEFGLLNGTTYNSYLIRGEKIAVVDTSHEKFRKLYLDTLTGLVDPKQIDYLIISHTEPDHSGLVKDMLALAPQATVVASKVAIQFLEDFVHHPFERIIVKNGDRLDLGNGHELEFVIAPNLHWPDTIFTFDHKTQTLYTCDAFGMHYCSESMFDEDLGAFEEEFRFYYDCLMAPNVRSVLSALKRMGELPEVTTIATGHGPVLFHNLEELVGRYRQWSQAQAKVETRVAVFYVSDYGYSDRLSISLARGITKTGVAVDMMDLKLPVDPQELNKIVGQSAGIVISMPPSSGKTGATAHATIANILAATHAKQAVGLIESFGGDDEPIDPLLSKFRDLRLAEAFPAIRIKDAPTEATYQLCEEAGTDLGQALTRDRRAMKSIDSDLDKALGRISGGMYIVTAKKGEVTGATLASWVVQASFKPYGFTMSVAKDRAIESMMQVGDRLVLNILEEGNYQNLMKHFLKRFAPGADRFAGVKTQASGNGAPILIDAIAYLECQVASYMECNDHWIVYCTVQDGSVSKTDAQTAVRHRKVGNYY